MQRLPLEKENAIHTWLSHILTGTTVIWAFETGPLPQKPFAVVNIISGPEAIGAAAQQYHSVDTYTYIMRKRCTLSVQIYGEGALLRANDIVNAMELPSLQTPLQNTGVAVWDVSSPKDITALVETVYEARAVVELTLAWAEAKQDTPGEIRTVSLSGKANGHITHNQIDSGV